MSWHNTQTQTLTHGRTCVSLVVKQELVCNNELVCLITGHKCIEDSVTVHLELLLTLRQEQKPARMSRQ